MSLYYFYRNFNFKNIFVEIFISRYYSDMVIFDCDCVYNFVCRFGCIVFVWWYGSHFVVEKHSILYSLCVCSVLLCSTLNHAMLERNAIARSMCAAE